MNKTMMMGLALVLASLPMTMLVAAIHAPGWSCPPEPIHTYGTGGSASANSASTVSPGIGVVTVTDTNALDCDGDGIAGDWDGDFDAGVGGSFHGYGQHATDPDCNYHIRVHGPTVAVSDFNQHIAFVTGADQTFGPTKTEVDHDQNSTTPPVIVCTTDGVIDGDDVTGNDCISVTYVTPATGTACGEGGDGGFWTFVSGIHIEEAGGIGGSIAITDPATFGTITAT